MSPLWDTEFGYLLNYMQICPSLCGKQWALDISIRWRCIHFRCNPSAWKPMRNSESRATFWRKGWLTMVSLWKLVCLDWSKCQWHFKHIGMPSENDNFAFTYLAMYIAQFKYRIKDAIANVRHKWRTAGSYKRWVAFMQLQDASTLFITNVHFMFNKYLMLIVSQTPVPSL